MHSQNPMALPAAADCLSAVKRAGDEEHQAGSQFDWPKLVTESASHLAAAAVKSSAPVQASFCLHNSSKHAGPSSGHKPGR